MADSVPWRKQAFSSRVDKFKLRQVFPLASRNVAETLSTHHFGTHILNYWLILPNTVSIRKTYVPLCPLQRAWQNLANKGCIHVAPGMAYQLLNPPVHCDSS